MSSTRPSSSANNTSTDEVNTLLLTGLKENKQTAIDLALTKLKNLTDSELLNLCTEADYPDIQDFLYTDKTVASEISKRLKEKEYVSIPIISMDGQIEIPTLHHFIAAHLLADIANNRSTQDSSTISNLDIACDLGFYSALIARNQTNMNKLKSATDPSKINEIIKQLVSDSTKLINLYWETGFIRSACVSYTLSLYFDNTDKTRSQAFKDNAVKNFVSAWKVMDHPTAKAITQDIVGNDGWLPQLANILGVKSWDEAESKFIDWCGGKNNYIKIKNEAENEAKPKSFFNDRSSTLFSNDIESKNDYDSSTNTQGNNQ